MVLSLSLPVPGFTKATPTSTAGSKNWNNDSIDNDSPSTTATTTTTHTTVTTLQTGTRRKEKSNPNSTDQSSPSPSTSSTTLNEALRNNPFGTTSHSRARAVAEKTAAAAALAVVDAKIRAKQLQEEERRRELRELNDALITLARLFPDVRVEVFRELLIRFDGNSRLQVCVEQLLRYKKEWVKGRWNVLSSSSPSPFDVASTTETAGGTIATDEYEGADVVPREEMFRSEEYKTAVRMALSKEFSSLSRSALDAVLAEFNYSYSRARPTLRELSRKGWRATFSSLIPSTFKRKKDKDDHPMLGWHRSPRSEEEPIPYLKETGCEELDGELHAALVEPLLSLRRQSQQSQDLQLAESLNESEAKAANALYECDCCLADVTFEHISTCSSNAHIICHGCIRRTLQEALFGQGWDKSINPEKSTLRCIAPVAHGSCEGDLDANIVKTAVLADRGGSGAETYAKFEGRLASEALLKSQLKLVRCPFCNYAEIDPIYHPQHGGIAWRFRRNGNLLCTVLMTILLLDLIPLLFFPILLVLLVHPQSIQAVLNSSVRSLCLKSRTRRFHCANPSCKRDSCMNCQRSWRDPHVCHEPLLLSLRTTVEAARTAAIKRTCPRCGLSFVKSTGCNKLNCVCGYSMCYLCRKALGPPLKRPRNNNNNNPLARYADFEAEAEDDGEAGGEGYKHFCEHFRINPGTRCTECNKCDLYLAEDEEAVARRAGEKAEQEWRLRAQKHALRQQQQQQQQYQSISTIIADQRRGSAASSILSSRSNSIQVPAIPATVPLTWSWSFDPQSQFEGIGHGHGGDKAWRLRWRYWLDEVWRDGRWRWEGQALVDWIVERTIVIVDQ